MQNINLIKLKIKMKYYREYKKLKINIINKNINKKYKEMRIYNINLIEIMIIKRIKNRIKKIIKKIIKRIKYKFK